jgi:hypothetical protein
MNATPTPQLIETDLKTIFNKEKPDEAVSRTTSTLKDDLKSIHSTIARNPKG